MKVPQRAMKKWIAALRSGEYEQTGAQLQSPKGFCCLGVACEVLIPRELQNVFGGRLLGSMPSSQKASPKWLQLINSETMKITGIDLVTLNDSRLANFNEIADLLESLYVENP
jgi:hypothetical protein